MNEIKRAYAEVYCIIGLLEEEYRNELPAKLIAFFGDEMEQNYFPKFDKTIPLEEQNLLQYTIALLAMLKLNYWCKNEEEKKELQKLLDDNEKKYQEELREQYNPDNLFKNRTELSVSDKEETSNETSLVEYKKDNFVVAILKKIARLFSRG